MIELSSLDAVDLREVWPNEARDFTPWLATHIDLLGEVLGLDLELEREEAEVGSFSLDVLARDVGNNRPVVIENQLEATDHDHLGKLLTYAAGHDAHVVVWLVREFRPEHRAALDWLNQRTDEDTAFFGVAVEAWRIAGSPPAPRFNVVVVPNDWERQVAHERQGADESETKVRQRAFFQQLINELRETHGFTKAKKGQPQNWYHFSSGIRGMQYNASFSRDDKAIAGLYIDNGDKERNKALFDQLEERRAEIENKVGFELDWDRRDDIVASYVNAVRDGSIHDDDAQLEEIRNWMVERLLEFKRVFDPHLREIVS